MQSVREQVEELRRLVRSSAATIRGMRTVDIELDEENKPVLIRRKPMSSYRVNGDGADSNSN